MFNGQTNLYQITPLTDKEIEIPFEHTYATGSCMEEAIDNFMNEHYDSLLVKPDKVHGVLVGICIRPLVI